MTTSNLDRAMVAAKRYAALRERGDVTLAGEERRLIESLVGAFGEGVFQLPLPVAVAMGRRDLGPRYEVVGVVLAAGGQDYRRNVLSGHYTREGAESEADRVRRGPGGWGRVDVREVQS